MDDVDRWYLSLVPRGHFGVIVGSLRGSSAITLGSLQVTCGSNGAPMGEMGGNHLGDVLVCSCFF